MFSQLDEGAGEVDAGDQDDEGHGPKEGPQTGLPGHPAAEHRGTVNTGFLNTV